VRVQYNWALFKALAQLVAVGFGELGAAPLCQRWRKTWPSCQFHLTVDLA